MGFLPVDQDTVEGFDPGTVPQRRAVSHGHALLPPQQQPPGSPRRAASHGHALRVPQQQPQLGSASKDRASRDEAVRSPSPIPPGEDVVKPPESVAEVVSNIRSTGRITLQDFELLCGDLAAVFPIQGVPSVAVAHALKSGRVRSLPAGEQIWFRMLLGPTLAAATSGLALRSTPNTSTSPELVLLVLSGKVQVIRRKKLHGEILCEGAALGTGPADIIGVNVLDAAEVMVWTMNTVREALRSAGRNLQILQHEFQEESDLASWPEETVALLADYLLNVPFFEDHSLQVLKRLVPHLRLRSHDEEEILLKLGEHVDGLILVLEGSIGLYAQQMISNTGKASKQSVRRAYTSPASADLAPRSSSHASTESTSYPVLQRQGTLTTNQVYGAAAVLSRWDEARFSHYCLKAETDCMLLSLTREAYIKILSQEQLDKQRCAHVLSHIPPTHNKEASLRSEVDLAMLCKIIRGLPEFVELPSEMLLQVMSTATYLLVAPGHVLARQGEEAEHFFALIDGKVAVHINPLQGEQDAPPSSEDVAVRPSIKSAVATITSNLRLRAALGTATPEAPPLETPSQELERSMSRARGGNNPRLNVPNVAAQLRANTQEVRASSKETPSGQLRVLQAQPRAGSDQTGASYAPHEMAQLLSSAPVERTTGESAGGRAASRDEAPGPAPSIGVFLADGKRAPAGSPSISRNSVVGSLEDLPRSSRSRRQAIVPVQDEDRVSELRATERTASRLNMGRSSFFAAAALPPILDEPDLGHVVSILEGGAAFGAATLLRGEARPASAIALEMTKLLVVSREDYWSLLKAKLEADLRDKVSFLQKNLPGWGKRKTTSLQGPELLRVEKAAKELSLHTFQRGDVIVEKGQDSQMIWALKSGFLAVCREGPKGHRSALEGRERRPHAVAALAASCILSGSSTWIGTSSAVLGYEEPVTIRVESATCEMFQCRWADFRRQLPSTVEEAFQARELQNHQRRAATAPVPSLSDVGRREADERVSDAWRGIFNAARALDGEMILADGLEVGAMLPEQTTSTKYNAVLEATIGRLHQERARAKGLAPPSSSAAASKGKRSSRPPPDTSAERIRAVLLQALALDGSEGVRQMFQTAMLDPEKDDLRAWVEKYMLNERLRVKPQHQGLRLLVRQKVTHAGPRAVPERSARSLKRVSGQEGVILIEE